MAKQVGIVICNYNGWQDTLECLASLRRQTFSDFEVILVDDASTNDSVEKLKAALSADIVFLPQEKNLGFSAANNVGIQRALQGGVQWVLLLNNDTTCAPDMLELLLQQTPDHSVSSPKMLFMAHPQEIWFAGGHLSRKTGKAVHFGGHQQDGAKFSQRQQVNFLTFCCVLLPREAIQQIGLLNETLFMYCEDVDYCIRLADAGYSLWLLPDAKLWHKAGGSAGGMLSVYYITRNTLYLRCKNRSSLYTQAQAIWVVLRTLPPYAVAWLCGHKKGRSYGAFRGALDFLHGAMGRWSP